MLLTAYRTKLLLARTILTSLIICCQGQLCVEEEPRTKAQQEQEAFLRAIDKCEDIEALVRGMAKYPSDPAIQGEACFRLRTLCNLGKALEIANLGGIQAILKAMKDHATEAKVQEKACLALDYLSAYAENKALMMGGGGEEVVRTAMAAANATDNTKKHGQKLLDALAQDPEREAFLHAIGSEEDIETLVRGMAKYPSDPAIQEEACGRLGTLSRGTSSSQ